MTQPTQHLFWVNHQKARYYQVHLDRDLLGDWTLRTVWGGLRSRLGRMHCTGVASYDDGIEQVRVIAKRRRQRGYAGRPWPMTGTSPSGVPSEVARPAGMLDTDDRHFARCCRPLNQGHLT